MTPEYGAAPPAREDRHARLRRRRGDQQVRAPRRRGRAARRRPPAGPQPRGVRQAARGHAGLRHQRRDVRRRRRDRALPVPRGTARPSTACTSTRAPLPRVECSTPRGSARWSRPTGSATSPRSPRPSATTTPEPRSWSTQARRAPAARGRRGRAGRRPAGRRSRTASRRLARRSTPTSRSSSRPGRAVVQEYAEHPGRESLSGNRIPRVAAAGVRRPRRAGALLAPREPAGPLPLHRRRLPVQARERGPGPDVRRRGRPGAHQPPVQAAVGGTSRRPGSRRRSTR